MHIRKYSLPLALSCLLLAQSGTAVEDRTFSPRGFCHQTGGHVSETGHPKRYICCYPGKRKCILSDVAKGHSRIIPLADTALALTGSSAKVANRSQRPCRR